MNESALALQPFSAGLEQFKLLASPLEVPSPALFLDRDGVIIEDRHHISDPNQVRLCRGARDLIATANINSLPVVVVSNQSGIARGLFTWHDVERVNEKMQFLLGDQAPLAAIYMNGHGPCASASSWRKPSPAMLVAASKALNLELRNSILIGDRLSDLMAGAAAGVHTVFHVLSGHGQNSRQSVVEWYSKAVAASCADEPYLYCLPSLQLLDGLGSFPFSLLSRLATTSR